MGSEAEQQATANNIASASVYMAKGIGKHKNPLMKGKAKKQDPLQRKVVRRVSAVGDTTLGMSSASATAARCGVKMQGKPKNGRWLKKGLR